ncbi:MAG TPA: KEOPS complex subunit Pcc1 [Candidatus Methanoperedens sp.]|nr:KEOPS complex subunit Pcc1 [Candidatus Methanoperedens sp.]
MLVLAEFEFDAGKDARIIYEALLPELDQDYQRTRTTLGLKSEVLVLKVEANDTVSMRAALNGWLRLIKITYEMCCFTQDTQVIN